MLADPLLNSVNPAVLLNAFDCTVRDELYALVFCFTLRLMSRSPRDLPNAINDGSA